MTSNTTPLPYDVIPSEENPLYTVFGAACVPYEQYIYYFMTKMCGDAYQGGSWEFRKYPNGALAMVFPSDKVIDPVTLNGYSVTCSLEAISYAINLIVVSGVGSEASNKGSEALQNLCHDMYHGLLDMLAGRMRFIITPGEGDGFRDPSEEEIAAVLPRLRKHPELSAIGEIID